MATLRKLGNSKVLVVESDPTMAKHRTEFLKKCGASVEVVAYEFQALTRLGKPGHDYQLVLLEGGSFSPEQMREMLLGQDLFGDTEVN